MIRAAALALPLVILAGPAVAGDKPLYAPAPTWVALAPPLDMAKLGSDAPVNLVLDVQQRLEGGQVWTYRETVERAASTQVLGRIGTISIPWQPQHGDLIIHKVEIVRGNERIDLIKGGTPFTVLRREQQLSQRILDGVLTATMPVEGLRVGDLLRIVASTTLKDATLKGRLQSAAPLVFLPARTSYSRARLMWPKDTDIRWQAGDGVARTPVESGGFKVLEIAGPLPKLPEIPNDAPPRFRPIPLVEASSFSGWADVATVMAPLYKTDGLIAPGSALDAEVAKIAAADSDPLRRTAAALRLVQDKLRYQLVALGAGNYVPQTPAESWSLRYGDCKAKTLMLLAILHKLGIEAEPVMASLSAGDVVAKRLPAAAAFDHVLVKATVGGETLWLDGTGAGSRYEDVRDTPPLGWVLPVRASGAELLKVETRAPVRPGFEVALDLDQRAGFRMPAMFGIAITVRGGFGEAIRMMSAQADKDQLEELVTRTVSPFLANPALAGYNLKFDEAAGTATIEATGLSYTGWERDNERWKLSLDKILSGNNFSPDRTRPAWRDIPVSTGRPGTTSVTTRLTLPDNATGYTVEGKNPLSDAILAGRIARTSTLAGGVWTVTTRAEGSGGEVAASAVPVERRRLADLKAQPLRIVAPEIVPAYWQQAEDAKRRKLTAPMLAVLTKRIAEKPDKAERYAARAWFQASIFDRTAAIADLSKAIEIEPSATLHLRRAALYYALSDIAKARADATAARDLDPESVEAVTRLAETQAEGGDRDGALAFLQDRIDIGGDNKPRLIGAKAQLQADGGDREGAFATLDAGVVQYPGNTALLNARCWIKGLFNTALDTALKDCTKAIELSEDNVAALDSRALAYFRMGRTEDALADLEAVLKQSPDKAESLYLRGVIRRKTGKVAEAELDIKGAKIVWPRVAEPYAKYGVAP
jgi:tetratricopeptide (TPR) repeat protein/transglutaminase-like putative cysteine protease